MPYLIASRGPAVGLTYRIESSPYVLGRRADCDLFNVFADDAAVSRRHAQITTVDDVIAVEDLGSANGTWVNGRQVRERTVLAHGDRLAIGAVEFTFSTSPPEESQQAAAGRRTLDKIALDRDGDWELLGSVPVAAQAAGEATAKDAARRLSALVSLLARLGQTLEIDATLAQLLEGLFDVFPNADRGFIGLRSAEDNSVQPRVVHFRGGGVGETFRLSRTIIEHVMGTGDAIISADAQVDERFRTSRSISSYSIRSFLCAPLLDGDGRTQGVVEIESLDASAPFRRPDLELLASIAPHASLALNYARMHAAALERQALEHDLKLARQVQLGLLPDGPPDVPGYEFHAVYQAAQEVGGDFYDYIRLPNGRIAVVVADVAGKGISAALLAAKAAAELKCLLSSEPTAAQALARLNDSLCAADIAGRFVTLGVAVLDPSRHEVEWVNAGHPAPFLRKLDGTTAPLGAEARGAAIGMFPARTYAAASARLAAGDCLVLFTDGVNEATNRKDELYGLERLHERIRAGPAEAEPLVRSVLEDVRRFVDGHRQSDDVSLICVRRV